MASPQKGSWRQPAQGDVYKRQALRFLPEVFPAPVTVPLSAVLIVRVLGKVGSGFLIPGNLRVFLFEFLLCFLKKYLLVLLIDSLTFFAVCPAGKNPVNHFAAGFLWLHLIAVIGG